MDFLNAVTLTAELDHFTVRSFVTLAYDWLSHQNIVEHLVGIDKQRAINASYQFKNTLALLAEHTDARKIHIVSYSAGGRVVSRALHEPRLEHPQMTKSELKSHYRIGTVIFAAADVEVDRFLKRLEDISDLSEQTFITVSDADHVLEHARQIMGGRSRIGSVDAEPLERNFITRHNLLNVHIVDVSSHKEQRGFDIGGHHYWYRHPWMSSDIIFLLQHGAPPHERVLSYSEKKWHLVFRAGLPGSGA